jgi:4-amino-4-deoxy-L-arabinose transferase-like glycosyltransferase
MPRLLASRLATSALIVLIGAGLNLPGLGNSDLWDMDEGLNAEAARQMVESGDWVVPTFNGELRSAKPVLLYWLQAAAYRVFGVNEFAARLPSALAGIVALLLINDLGRRMFGAATGFLAAVIAASTILLCGLSHSATTDAVLLACTVLTFHTFWRGRSAADGRWLVPTGMAAGLAVLAKGPVGVAMPGAVIVLFLAIERQLRRLWTRWLILGVLAFLLVAVPWYALVGWRTGGEFLRVFLLGENVGRFLSPMEGHKGPVVYHPLALFVGFAPWSVFLLPTAWFAVRGCRIQSPERSAYRFLACWAGGYLVFFSLAATKLPNYLLPAYPPLAILTADLLDRWRRGDIRVPNWVWAYSLGSLVLVGVVIGGGLLVAGGLIGPSLMRGHPLEGLGRWAWLGLIPVAGAVVGFWCLRRQARTGLVAGVSATSLLLVGTLAAVAGPAVDREKAPRALVATAARSAVGTDPRVGGYRYFQPSLVYYARRPVVRLMTEEAVVDFLARPGSAYLFLTVADWEKLAPCCPPGCREVGRHWDLYRACEVAVVTNQS